MSANNSTSTGGTPDVSAKKISELEDASLLQDKSMFDEHKGKLAIGIAATLGIMIFYNWRERQIARNDPAGHARLQKLKAIIRANDIDGRHEQNRHHAENESSIVPSLKAVKNIDEPVITG